MDLWLKRRELEWAILLKVLMENVLQTQFRCVVGFIDFLQNMMIFFFLLL